MRLVRRFGISLVLSAGGLLLGIAIYHMFCSLPQFDTAPVLRYADYVDLGECEQGAIAEGSFWVSNGGGGVLILDRFRTSCSCACVELREDGKGYGVESIRLRAGERVELTLRMSVGAQAGQRQAVACSFASNDPDRPDGRVEAVVSRVMGGVVTLPNVVMFGNVPPRTANVQAVKIYDGGQAGRRIQSVRSTQPQRFSVTFVPAVDSGESHEQAGNLLGVIEVKANTEEESTLDGEVEIILANEGRRPDRLAVVGRVVGDVGVAPQSLLLPRRVRGQAVYHAELRVWSYDGKPVSVRVEPSDSPLTIEVLPVQGRSDQRRVRVEWMARRGERASEQRIATVRLLIRAGNKEYVRDVRILRHELEP